MSQRYILSDRIARGGMAEIYLGKYVGSTGDFERLCAIKKILPHYAQDPEYLEMFRTEASICKRLQHSNIVQVYDFKKINDTYAIIMEYVDGMDLRAILAECEKANIRLSVPMIAYLGSQVAKGLHYAHTRVDPASVKPLDIVHRDVSPQNVLVSYEGDVKIIDFGIAKFEAKSQETKVGVVKGKYSYMSPEQIHAKDLDARTDVFSLAIVLWEALAMKRLFAGRTEVETIRKVQEAIPKHDLRELNKNVDEELYAILMKGLAKERKNRYVSASAFDRDLQKYLNSKFPSFDPSELGELVAKLFIERRIKFEKIIQDLLGSTTLSKVEQFEEIVTSNKNAVNATAEFLQNAQQPESHYLERVANGSFANGTNQYSQASRPQSPGADDPLFASNRHSMKKTYHNQIDVKEDAVWGVADRALQVSHLIIPSLLALILFFLSLYFYSKQPQNVDFQLLIKTHPQSVQIEVDGVDMYVGEYIQTPSRITLPSGQRTVRLKRKGFQSVTLDLKAKVNDFFTTDTISLRPLALPTTRISITTEPATSAYIIMDKGFYTGPSDKRLPPLLRGESYSVEVYPYHPDRKDAFRCTFQASSNPTMALRLIMPSRGRPARCLTE
jgi:serine/threonine protein kinase